MCNQTPPVPYGTVITSQLCTVLFDLGHYLHTYERRHLTKLAVTNSCVVCIHAFSELLWQRTTSWSYVLYKRATSCMHVQTASQIEPPSFCERTIRVLLNTANGCLQTPFKTSDRCSDHNTVVHFQLRGVYYLGVCVRVYYNEQSQSNTTYATVRCVHSFERCFL